MDITKRKKKKRKVDIVEKSIESTNKEELKLFEKEKIIKSDESFDVLKLNQIPSFFEIKADGLEEVRYDGGEKLILEFNLNKITIHLNQNEVIEINNLLERMRMSSEFNQQNPKLEKDFLIKDEKIKLRVAMINEEVGKTKNPQFTIRKNLDQLLTENQFNNLFQRKSEKKVGSDVVKNIFEDNPTIIISGETGSGKTEIQKYLVKLIDDYFSIVSIADTNDTNLKSLFPSKDISEFFTSKYFSMNDGLSIALRYNPSFIFISEIRKKEITNFYEAISTGHKTITTVHANNAFQTIDRLTNLYNKHNSSTSITKEEMQNNIDYIIHVKIKYVKNEKTGKFEKVRYIDKILKNTGDQKLGTFYENKESV